MIRKRNGVTDLEGNVQFKVEQLVEQLVGQLSSMFWYDRRSDGRSGIPEP